MNGLTPEWVSAVASVLALLVVAIGSYAALRQIAHLRQGLRTELGLRLFEQYQSKRVRTARAFVRNGLAEALADEQLRARLRDGIVTPEVERVVPLANFFESLGFMVVAGSVDQGIVIDEFPILEIWEGLAPMIALMRVARPKVFEMFEYLATLEVDRNASRGSMSAYPAGARRMPLPAIDEPP